MRRGNEGGLELRRRKKICTVKHFAEEAGIALGVGTLGAGVVADRLFGEEERAEGASGIDLAGNFCLDQGSAKAGREAVGLLGDAVVEAVNG